MSRICGRHVCALFSGIASATCVPHLVFFPVARVAAEYIALSNPSGRRPEYFPDGFQSFAAPPGAA
eukprot:12943582-Alexandrium_andersonii.AAC.1